jgi:hypothetical protein
MATKIEQQAAAVTLNAEQRLYVIPCGGGYSCLGFDVCDRQAKALALELGETWSNEEHITGTIETYNDYQALLARARATGRRFTCELTKELIGLEGKRVEVVDCYGEKRRFYVGKSTGFIPIHLEILKSNSTGGGGVTGTPFKSIRVLDKRRY